MWLLQNFSFGTVTNYNILKQFIQFQAEMESNWNMGKILRRMNYMIWMFLQKNILHTWSVRQ